jgi:hypothetical protein
VRRRLVTVRVSGYSALSRPERSSAPTSTRRGKRLAGEPIPRAVPRRDVLDDGSAGASERERQQAGTRKCWAEEVRANARLRCKALSWERGESFNLLRRRNATLLRGCVRLKTPWSILTDS